MKDVSITVQGVSKMYKLYRNPRERLLDFLTPKSYGEPFFALQNVSFTLQKGEVLGFIGSNGSGKSTLSSIIAGITPPTNGSVEVVGSVRLLAVSTGLKNDLTGRENIELKCLMLGFSKERIRTLLPDIIQYSELGAFIDQPVKSYSSGMKSRLGFSISIHADPDILIIDEALSVGDKAFAEKCLASMQELKKQGKTMIFVSHSISQMKRFCTKMAWLHQGELRQIGEVSPVLDAYEDFVRQAKKKK